MTTGAPNRAEFAKVSRGSTPPTPATCSSAVCVPGTRHLHAGLRRVQGDRDSVRRPEPLQHLVPAVPGAGAAGTVPAFNYMILPNDHTDGTTTKDFTPQAMIADNDLALGQIVDAISHSSIWPSSAIFVVEDDSQDGADHVDSHRAPGFVISPWARHGAVVHTRYDQYSMLRTLELILGLTRSPSTTPWRHRCTTRSLAARRRRTMPPMTSWRRRTRFQRRMLPPRPTPVCPANCRGTASTRSPRRSPDQILWASAHGAHATSPAPGPNASLDEHDRAVIVRSILRQTPRAFLQKVTSHSLRTARCPITWACRASAAGEP